MVPRDKEVHISTASKEVSSKFKWTVTISIMNSALKMLNTTVGGTPVKKNHHDHYLLNGNQQPLQLFQMRKKPVGD